MQEWVGYSLDSKNNSLGLLMTRLEPLEKVSSWSLGSSLMPLGVLCVAGHVVLNIRPMVVVKLKRKG